MFGDNTCSESKRDRDSVLRHHLSTFVTARSIVPSTTIFTGGSFKSLSLANNTKLWWLFLPQLSITKKKTIAPNKYMMCLSSIYNCPQRKMTDVVWLGLLKNIISSCPVLFVFICMLLSCVILVWTSPCTKLSSIRPNEIKVWIDVFQRPPGCLHISWPRNVRGTSQVKKLLPGCEVKCKRSSRARLPGERWKCHLQSLLFIPEYKVVICFTFFFT